jgi:hypothetical protein
MSTFRKANGMTVFVREYLRLRLGKWETVMEAIGLKVNDRTIANKIASGGFSAVFFLQCMEAIGVRAIHLDEALPSSSPD